MRPILLQRPLAAGSATASAKWMTSVGNCRCCKGWLRVLQERGCGATSSDGCCFEPADGAASCRRGTASMVREQGSESITGGDVVSATNVAIANYQCCKLKRAVLQATMSDASRRRGDCVDVATMRTRCCD